MRFKIDWASLIVLSKFTVLALFYFVFEGYFPSTRLSPWGAYIWRGDLTEGFLSYRFGGLVFGGAYFRNFTIYICRAKHPFIFPELAARNGQIQEGIKPLLDSLS